LIIAFVLAALNYFYSTLYRKVLYRIIPCCNL